MPIELAGIKLSLVHSVATLEQAAFAYHHIPGLQGSVVQDLGRDSVSLRIEGIFYGPGAARDLEALRKLYKQRQPADFLADIVGQAYFSQVTIEAFEVYQRAEEPDQYSYILTIAEYVVPPKPAGAAADSGVNGAVAAEAKKLLDIASLPDALRAGTIPELTNPAEPLSEALTQIKALSGDIGGIAAGIGALLELEVEVEKEQVALPDGLGEPAPLRWTRATTDGPTSDEPLLGPNGELLGKDGKPSRGANGELLGPDGKPLNLSGILLLVVQDTDGRAVYGERYILEGGAEAIEGTLDELGQARISGLDDGRTYTISFPGLDRGDGGDEGGGEEGAPAPATEAVSLAVVDEAGSPVGELAFELRDSTGSITTGRLGGDGRANLSLSGTGPFTLVFPELDRRDQAGTDDGGQDGGDTPNDEPDDGGPDGSPSDGTQPEPGALSLAVVDEEGKPAGALAFELRAGAGAVTTGRLDGDGRANLSLSGTGPFTLVFPELDQRDTLGEQT